MTDNKHVMKKHAVCLVTDHKYALPTVVAALQARVAAPAPDIDVFVFAVGLPSDKAAAYDRICARSGVRFILVSRDIFGGAAENTFVDDFFARSTLSFGSLGRFFLDQLVPAEYSELLYLDGDVLIQGPIDELVRYAVPKGKFFAASDPKVFWMGDGGAAALREERYMSGLGLSSTTFGGYFNTGVLRMNRSGWRDIGDAAWRFLQANQGLCLYHDQSALNAVAADRRLPCSLKWNFPVYFRHYGLDRDLSPSITHFMSRPKPWNGVFSPWETKEHQVYRKFVHVHPELAGDLDVFRGARAIKYYTQQHFKAVDEFVHFGRRARVRARVLAYEAAAIV